MTVDTTSQNFNEIQAQKKEGDACTPPFPLETPPLDGLAGNWGLLNCFSSILIFAKIFKNWLPNWLFLIVYQHLTRSERLF